MRGEAAGKSQRELVCSASRAGGALGPGAGGVWPAELGAPAGAVTHTAGQGTSHGSGPQLWQSRDSRRENDSAAGDWEL